MGGRSGAAGLPLSLEDGARLGERHAVRRGVAARVGIAEHQREPQPIVRRARQVGVAAFAPEIASEARHAASMAAARREQRLRGPRTRPRMGASTAAIYCDSDDEPVAGSAPRAAARNDSASAIACAASSAVKTALVA